MNYAVGLRTLKSRLSTDALDQVSVLEARLLENLESERLYGGTETTRADRARIVGELNRLSLTYLPVSFNDLMPVDYQNECSQLWQRKKAGSSNTRA